jgi:hypothetical protein
LERIRKELDDVRKYQQQQQQQQMQNPNQSKPAQPLQTQTPLPSQILLQHNQPKPTLPSNDTSMLSKLGLFNPSSLALPSSSLSSTSMSNLLSTPLPDLSSGLVTPVSGTVEPDMGILDKELNHQVDVSEFLKDLGEEDKVVVKDGVVSKERRTEDGREEMGMGFEGDDGEREEVGDMEGR